MVKSGTKSLDISKAKKSRSRVRSVARSAVSSRHGALAGTKDKNITIVSRGSPSRGKTDWAAVDALTDAQIEAAVRNDPDAVPLDFNWSEAVLIIPPKKKAISIRVDEDVLDYFKHEGAGYQRRINAVLRSYMEQKKSKKGKRTYSIHHPEVRAKVTSRDKPTPFEARTFGRVNQDDK
jgi:uncharacterized protein (DUF4415 family)